jgi:hypothetical protein
MTAKVTAMASRINEGSITSSVCFQSPSRGGYLKSAVLSGL